MSESIVVLDEVSAGGAELPVIAQPAPLDILDRQGFVDRMFILLETISSQNGSCTFALDGAWGSGKTFVLNMLEPKLREYRDGEKYLVFHYNCWQYDYYEEPLIAIVSALLDTLTNPVLVKTDAILEGVLQALKGINDDLFSFLFHIKPFQHIEEGKEKAKAVEASAHSFDHYFGFKKAMAETRNALHTLTQSKTLVIVVDELDRCLPEYAIKVLERLHHLFAELNNSIVILAVDKSQLDNTVKQIFGPDTATNEYLKKFINFHLSLDNGKISSGFCSKYRDYVDMFDKSLTELTFDLDEYVAALFSDISIRSQERLMERIKIAHTALFGGEKKDYIFMCFELMWLVFSQHYHATKNPLEYIGTEGHFCVNNDILPISEKLCEYITNSTGGRRLWSANRDIDRPYVYYYTLLTDEDRFQLLLYFFQQMFEDKRAEYYLRSEDLAPYERHMDSFRFLAQLLNHLQ